MSRPQLLTQSGRSELTTAVTSLIHRSERVTPLLPILIRACRQRPPPPKNCLPNAGSTSPTRAFAAGCSNSDRRSRGACEGAVLDRAIAGISRRGSHVTPRWRERDSNSRSHFRAIPTQGGTRHYAAAGRNEASAVFRSIERQMVEETPAPGGRSWGRAIM
jgi:hypothetical protein